MFARLKPALAKDAKSREDEVNNTAAAAQTAVNVVTRLIEELRAESDKLKNDIGCI